MATAIYVKRETVKQYVAHLKGMAERGDLEVGKSIVDITTGESQVGPALMGVYNRRNCRILMQDCGFISRVGGKLGKSAILSGKGIINNSFNNYSIDEATDLMMEAADNTKTGKAPTRMPNATVKEPDEPPAFLQANVFELVDVLNYREKAGLLVLLVNALTEPVAEMEKIIASHQQEVDRREREIVDIRSELRDTKAQLMQSREALGYAKSNIAPRVVERFVNIPNKPIPPGTQHGGTGGHAPGTVVVHRKPLMGHTPKVVREHATGEKEKKE